MHTRQDCAQVFVSVIGLSECIRYPLTAGMTKHERQRKSYNKKFKYFMVLITFHSMKDFSETFGQLSHFHISFKIAVPPRS
jgi:hypothetical protein